MKKILITLTLLIYTAQTVEAMDHFIKPKETKSTKEAIEQALEALNKAKKIKIDIVLPEYGGRKKRPKGYTIYAEPLLRVKDRNSLKNPDPSLQEAVLHLENDHKIYEIELTFKSTQSLMYTSESTSIPADKLQKYKNIETIIEIIAEAIKPDKKNKDYTEHKKIKESLEKEAKKLREIQHQKEDSKKRIEFMRKELRETFPGKKPFVETEKEIKIYSKEPIRYKKVFGK